jgi:hypothetical protein
MVVYQGETLRRFSIDGDLRTLFRNRWNSGFMGICRHLMVDTPTLLWSIGGLKSSDSDGEFFFLCHCRDVGIGSRKNARAGCLDMWFSRYRLMDTLEAQVYMRYLHRSPFSFSSVIRVPWN